MSHGEELRPHLLQIYRSLTQVAGIVGPERGVALASYFFHRYLQMAREFPHWDEVRYQAELLAVHDIDTELFPGGRKQH